MRWLWRLVGLGVVLAAAGLVWITADAALGRGAAWLLVALMAAGLPAVLAGFLLRAFRRIDAGAGYLESAAGLAVVSALGALCLLALVWRGPLADALEGAADRYPSAPRPAGRMARAAGRWIAPSAEPVADNSRDGAGRDHRAPTWRRPRAPDAGAGSRRGAADAGPAASGRDDDGGAGTPPRDPEPPPDSPPRDAETTETVRVCDEGSEVTALWAVDLGGARRAEIVVLCERDYSPTDARVFWLADDGRLRERTRFVVHAPADLTLNLAHPRVVDLDEDGAKDVLLCAFFTSSRGGPRGGDTWWARGEANGQLRAPTRLVGSSCAAIDAGDIDGDGHLELVVVHFGNPWFEARPEGEVRWYKRTNLQLRMRGREPVLPWPDGLALSDVNGDGKQDAIVHHEDGRGAVVLPGTARGLGPIDGSLTGVLPVPPRGLAVRLDRDAVDDHVEIVPGGSLRLTRSEPPGPAGDGTVRTPDFREHVLGAPAEDGD